MQNGQVQVDFGYYYFSFLGIALEQTQDVSLLQQLQYGVRALDLRIGQESPGNYKLVHDAFRTKYTLSEALQEVISFIDATEKEIVILDFHQFVNLEFGSKDYNYIQLKEQVKQLLNELHPMPIKHWRTYGLLVARGG